MQHPLLNEEDWSEYDVKKLIEGKNKINFDCAAQWELKFLTDELRKYFPDKKIETIESVIKFCCGEQKRVQNKEKFITAVISKLSESD